MAFDHKHYLNRFLADYRAGTFSNDSTANVERTIAKPFWRIIGIHHLTGDENRGKHHLYIDACDSKGKRLYPKIEWGWLGQKPDQHPNPVILDKPDNEPGGNIAIGSNQIVWARVLNEYSDKIFDVVTLLPDEGAWNTLGHHSHYVAFMWDDGTVTPEPPPVEPPTTPPPDDCAELRKQVAEAVKLLQEALGKLQ